MVFIMNTRSLCEVLLRSPMYHATPRQRQQFKQLTEAYERHDEEAVEQLARQIEDHYMYLNNSFNEFVSAQIERDELAVCMILTIFNDYAYPDAKRDLSRTLILAYGDSDQQDLAVAKKHLLDSRESLHLWREEIEENEFPEMCLDHTYATRRFRAACTGTNLINELVASCQWDELISLLDQDLETSLNLTLWLVQAGHNFEEFWALAFEIISIQAKEYRAIAEDRPDSADPPPPYSASDPNDPNAPPPPPSPATLMHATGLDILFNWVRGR